jgi:hypothetical protein
MRFPIAATHRCQPGRRRYARRPSPSDKPPRRAATGQGEAYRRVRRYAIIEAGGKARAVRRQVVAAQAFRITVDPP